MTYNPPVSCAYPLMLDVSSRLIVIIGGGSVASRKVRGLLEAGATRIRVVALKLSAELPEGIERINQPYSSGHLEGAGLVFAATDSAETNARIVSDAQARGLLVCRADAAGDSGDFSTPAKFTQGPVIVSVSAAGNPALAATIRDGLKWRFDKRWAIMAEAMKTLRPRILSHKTLSPEQRKAIFHTLASEDALYVLARDGMEALGALLLERHPELS